MPLVDHAIARVQVGTPEVAVNVHHGRRRLEAHLDGRAHLSVESQEALGTAGALGQLRGWIDGRPVLVTNADAWLPDRAAVVALLDGWDGVNTRLLTVEHGAPADFGTRRYCGVALLPWSEVRDLEAVPSGLYEVRWRAAAARGELELVDHDGPFVDCGTPADYLAANLLASGGSR